MMTFEVSQNEEARLDALYHYGILDTPHEASFDEIVLLAAQIGQTPVALLSFLDAERQWIKAATGFTEESIPRQQSLCAQTILQDTPLSIPDVRNDEYFRHTPLDDTLQDIRFYAGAPLVTPYGAVIGTLCIMDRFPRALAPRVRQSLVMLARQVMHQLELRRRLGENQEGLALSPGNLTETPAMAVTEAPNNMLAAQAAFYTALFELSPAYLCAHDLGGQIALVNQSLAAVFGVAAREIAGRMLAEFLSPDSQTELPEFLAQIEQKGAAQGLLRVIDKDGAERIWRYSSALYRQEGQGALVIGCGFDVTEQKQIERDLCEARRQALENARIKSDYLANLGHEIRAPMNGIVSMAHLLARTELVEEQLNYLDLIRDSADTLVTFINDLLDFSKLEAGMMKLERVEFNLLGLVENTITMFAAQAQGKGVELAFMVDAEVPPFLHGDPGRLRQILNNLISNAVKFTEQGEVVVQVEKLAANGDEISLRFTVRDTGSGMDEEFLPHLYQAYTQAHAATAQRSGGTGLGMAIAKQLVEIMQGRIEVESVVGEGTTFCVTLPFVCQSETAPANAANPLPDWQGQRVLIVDDNAASGAILRRQIKAWGMAPANVSAAEEAVAALYQAAQAGEPFTLAIIDCEMPGVDGIELARLIHAEARFATLPTILLTVFGWRGQGQAARDAGLAAYLTKPVRQAQLFECLVTVLGLRAEEQSTDAPKPLVTRHNLRNYTPISQPCRVLLVEDNTVNQQVAVHQLYKLGYTADVANNGREALQALAQHEYDVILLDCQMPEMDGYETAAAIRREIRPWQPYIVALTGYTDPAERAKCLAVGMDDFLSKPVEISQLEQVLQNRLNPALAKQTESEIVAAEVAAEPPNMELTLVEEPQPVSETQATEADEIVVANEVAEETDIAAPPDVEDEPPLEIEEAPTIVEEEAASTVTVEEQPQIAEEEAVASEVALAEPAPELVVEAVPAVDLSVLARLLSRDGKLKPALAIELIDMFLHDAATHQTALREAWPEQDSESLRRIAHTLKSSSASMGAKTLADSCALFTKQINATQFAAAETTLGELETELARVCAALRLERDKLA